MPTHHSELSDIRTAYDVARDRLIAERHPAGYWLGELSSSALSTATAMSALSLVSCDRFGELIRPAILWLKAYQNENGGWGDTPDSPSNLSTTLLVDAALRISGDSGGATDGCLACAGGYIEKQAGGEIADVARALRDAYGADRTFAVPILMNCMLAAEIEGTADWGQVQALPFELAWCPHAWFRWLRMHVVSYALPALVAIGQLIHNRKPTRNPLWRLLRSAAVEPTLRKLESIQPESGGFLEAVPLTSFVAMGLVAAGRGDHPVVRRGVEFLEASARPDGSWPIDTDLSTWLTTLSVNALAAGGELTLPNADRTCQWLIDRQYRVVHPYTNSPSGGWAWTHLTGGVPDADDTAGALLALAQLEREGTVLRGLSPCHAGTQDDAAGPPRVPLLSSAQQCDVESGSRREGTVLHGLSPGHGPVRGQSMKDSPQVAARAGLDWLLSLQNSDGGWPTFCRGWGKLPFDRSAPDLTAHALRAAWTWRDAIDRDTFARATGRAWDYLRFAQRSDGSWVPLWFGNQHAPDQENPVYGTSRALAAYRDLGRPECDEARRGVGYLVKSQNDDGGWGAASTVEETALAVEALTGWLDDPTAASACLLGAQYLASRVLAGGLDCRSPIGLYFAKLWYSERLYPIIFTVAAMGRFLSLVGGGRTDSGANEATKPSVTP